MKIVVIGGSGLIGKKLVSRLRQRGHEVILRRPPRASTRSRGEGLSEAIQARKLSSTLRIRHRSRISLCWSSSRPLGETCWPRKPPRGRASCCAVGRRYGSPAGEWLLSRKARPRKAYQGLKNSLYDRSPHPVLRVRGRHRPIGHRRADGSPLTRPGAADLLGRRGGSIGRHHGRGAGERHGRGGGSRTIPLDELVGIYLRATQDPREVVTDIHAGYFGVELNDQSLTAGDGARIAATRYQDWLSHTARQN